jgi:hypothetical protein
MASPMRGRQAKSRILLYLPRLTIVVGLGLKQIEGAVKGFHGYCTWRWEVYRGNICFSFLVRV